MHGKRRVSARRGWAGGKSDFFSILPDRLREDEHASSRIAPGFQLLQSAIGIGEGE